MNSASRPGTASFQRSAIAASIGPRSCGRKLVAERKPQMPDERAQLTLEDVPDDLLVECRLTRGGATGKSYRCPDKEAVLIPTVEVQGPPYRMLSPLSLTDGIDPS